MDFKFSCPQCGSEVFKTKSEPKSIEDFDGAVCNGCGAVITQDDIEAQAQQLASDLVRDALRKAGF